jgi:hypothetical protein
VKKEITPLISIDNDQKVSEMNYGELELEEKSK